ncbi:hypothetical protein G6M89_14735 [Natronolimnobius sp. AArcel1]|uniref:hypothetical protein n=1 Tax=Natronolimnobius sp. AArcel1 TaxID=1679093 RepID=UPI0013ECA5F1|nr:hypothetical protein [Natronolimnobius sp. AArcel1]NGM70250.1 hypothetical protein [Natronolimnobius sp. AArcel1]
MEESAGIPIQNSGEVNDDLRSQIDIVTWYFGEEIDRVAMHHPVRRSELIEALATIQLYGLLLRDEDALEISGVVHESSHEEVLVLKKGFWTRIEQRGIIPRSQIIAVRDIHESIVNTLRTDQDTEGGDSFVMVTADPDAIRL